MNCGSLAEGVLESELFGHERGSFTGAVAKTAGAFRAREPRDALPGRGRRDVAQHAGPPSSGHRDGGIPAGRRLRARAFRRENTSRRRTASLDAAVERGEFRKDLYYRLRVVQIRIPPLRARPDDIPLLVHYFIAQAGAKHGRRIRGIEKEGMDLLMSYPWPGNVRELANIIDNLAIMSSGSDDPREST